MLEFFQDGGPFMWPILILFIIGIVISLYKLFALLGTAKNAGQLMADIKKALATQGVAGALKLVQGGKPVEELINAGLKNVKHGLDTVEKSHTMLENALKVQDMNRQTLLECLIKLNERIMALEKMRFRHPEGFILETKDWIDRSEKAGEN